MDIEKAKIKGAFKFLIPLIWPMVKLAYAQGLREAIYGAIEDPDSTLDERAIEVLDKIFGFK